MVIDTHPADAPIDSRFKKTTLILGRVWRIVFGIVLCQAPVTAVLALGWSYRFLRREAFRCWFRAARAEAQRGDFAAFVADDPKLAGVALWPNWINGQGYKPTPPDKLDKMRLVAWHAGVLFERATGSLWSNLRTGVKALLTLWMVTLPAGLLWLIAWWSGWNNSFSKGYEQAWVGSRIGHYRDSSVCRGYVLRADGSGTPGGGRTLARFFRPACDRTADRAAAWSLSRTDGADHGFCRSL